MSATRLKSILAIQLHALGLPVPQREGLAATQSGGETRTASACRSAILRPAHPF